MYPNLRAEMARRNLTQEDIAKRLGKTTASVSCKMRGLVPFTFDEATQIKDLLGTTDIPLEVLFERVG